MGSQERRRLLELETFFQGVEPEHSQRRAYLGVWKQERPRGGRLPAPARRPVPPRAGLSYPGGQAREAVDACQPSPHDPVASTPITASTGPLQGHSLPLQREMDKLWSLGASRLEGARRGKLETTAVKCSCCGPERGRRLESEPGPSVTGAVSSLTRARGRQRGSLGNGLLRDVLGVESQGSS